MTGATVASIFRYPVKGLSPEPLEHAALEAGRTLAGDRIFAIENGSRDFDPAAPRHFPKIKYLMLMKNERLAALQSRYDEQTGILALARGGKQVVAGNLRQDSGRRVVEQFLAAYMGADMRGSPRIVHAPGFAFTDVAAQWVSLINLGTVRALEQAMGKPVDPLRFRANVYVDGLDPWVESGWIGQTLTLGEAQLEVMHPIVRCAAVNVDPETAARDMAIPQTLMRTYGHMNLGIYANVTASGRINVGDGICFRGQPPRR